MRDRLFTPFFPLERGQQATGREQNSPDSRQLVSARALEGRVVGNGRYLLLRKVEHTESSASFRAKDMVGGIDVDIELLRDEEDGFRLGRSDVTPRPMLMLDLLDDDHAQLDASDGAAVARPAADTRSGIFRRMRAWLRRRRP